MTRLEDKIRRAIHAKADQVSSDTVPPLRLPARRRRSFSLAHGGGERMGAPAWRRWFAPAASAALVLGVIAGSVMVSRLVLGGEAPGGPGAAAPASLEQAAAWVAGQVSRSAVVACDPAMCRLLRAHRVSHLDELLPTTATPVNSAVIVATAAVREQFGSRLGGVYAPTVIASFGSGTARTDVRVTAPDGPAAYRSALSKDLAARKQAGAELLSGSRITTSPAARRAIAAGRVDSRLLIVIVTMAAEQHISIVSFTNAGPGAGADSPFRAAELVGPSATDRSTFTQPMISLLQAQSAPFLPAQAHVVQLRGQVGLYIEYTAPSPLGLLGPSNS
ncbi:MAG TPA: hypothetical protein VGJ50_07765 [Streptosporangiaceae bacterium]